MKQLSLFTTGLIVVGLLATEQASRADLTTFTGVDVSATSRATGPNSMAAEAAFLTAAGVVQTVDFENTGLPDGNIVGQTLAAEQLGVTGLTITTIDQVPDKEDIGLNITSGTSNPVGFNTTPAGDNRLVFLENGSGEPSAELQFNFADPIFAFGLYLSGGGANGGTDGVPSIVAGGDSIEISEFVSIPKTSGGLQYIGFTSDTGFSQVLMRLEPEGGDNDFFFGIDDVSFSASAIPEPSSLALLLFGAVSLFGCKMHRKARRR